MECGAATRVSAAHTGTTTRTFVVTISTSSLPSRTGNVPEECQTPRRPRNRFIDRPPPPGSNPYFSGFPNCSLRPSERKWNHSFNPAGSRRVTRKNQENRIHSCGNSFRIPG